MALAANVNFYFQLTKSGAGVTGKSASITATIKKVTRGSSPTITTVTTAGGVVVGSVSEVDATNNKGVYVVGVSGLDPTADYMAGAHYTGTSTDVDNVDLPSYQADFSLSIIAGAIPQAQAGASGGVPLSVDASGRVDVLKINGTLQTARDIGASVLLSNGTGAGQISLSSGDVTVGGYATGEDPASLVLATPSQKLATDASGNVSANLSSTGQQQLAQIVGRANKRYFVRTDGSGADGLTLATAYTSVVTAANAASAVAGAEVVVGPGTFTEGVMITQAANGALRGEDRGTTIITNNTVIFNPIIQLASHSSVSHLQVAATLTGVFQYLIGDSTTAVTDALIYDVRGKGRTDVLFLGSANSSARMFDFAFESQWDNIALTANGITLDAHHGTLLTVGPNDKTPTANSTVNVKGAGTVLRLSDTRITNTATDVNASRLTKVVYTRNDGTSATGARIELTNVSILTNISATELVYHLYCGANCTIVCTNVSYDPSKVGLELQVFGTPTGGTFALTVANALGTQTATINYNDSASSIQTKLQALSNVGNGNVTVAGLIIGFTTLPASTLTMTFAASLGPVTLSITNNSLMGGTSPSAGVGNIVIQNAPINEAGQIAAGAFGPNVTLPTVANLTNLPAIPNNWLTAAGINAGALNGKGDWLLASSYTAPDNADIVTSLNDLVTLLARTDPTTAITAIKTVTDKINTTLQLNGAGPNYQLTQQALALAPTGSGGGGLSGPSSVTLTFHDASGNPVPNVEFTLVGIGAGRANASGVATFGASDGTYTVAAAITAGMLFSNTSLTVSGTTALTISGTAISFNVAPPGRTTVYLTTRDQSGNAVSGVIVQFQITAAPPGASGDAFNAAITQVTSNGSGLVQIALPVGATFNYWTIKGPTISATVPASGPYALPDLIGSYTA